MLERERATLGLKPEMKIKKLTGISLDAGGDLASTDVVEVGDVLTEDGAEVALTEALGIDFTRVDPDEHVGVGAAEHADACRKRGGEMGQEGDG